MHKLKSPQSVVILTGPVPGPSLPPSRYQKGKKPWERGWHSLGTKRITRAKPHPKPQTREKEKEASTPVCILATRHSPCLTRTKQEHKLVRSNNDR